MNTSALDFIVVNVRTGNPVAAFLLPGDALKYIAYRRTIEGPNGPDYDIRNSDESPISDTLCDSVEMANRLAKA